MMSALLHRLRDPFGFEPALADLSLAPEDLPGLTRECRQRGAGC